MLSDVSNHLFLLYSLWRIHYPLGHTDSKPQILLWLHSLAYIQHGLFCVSYIQLFSFCFYNQHLLQAIIIFLPSFLSSLQVSRLLFCEDSCLKALRQSLYSSAKKHINSMFYCLSPLLTLAVKVIHNLTLIYFSILMFLCFNAFCFMYMQFPFSMFLLMLFLCDYDFFFFTKIAWNKPFKFHLKSNYAHETSFMYTFPCFPTRCGVFL